MFTLTLTDSTTTVASFTEAEGALPEAPRPGATASLCSSGGVEVYYWQEEGGRWVRGEGQPTPPSGVPW
jgi:hypothetical protein